MSGDVGIEGRLSDMRTGTSIMEFKAYNTDPITLFSVKEFERFAFDQQNLQLFASGISAIFKGGPSSYIPKTGKLTWTRFKRLFRLIPPCPFFRIIEGAFLHRLPGFKGIDEEGDAHQHEEDGEELPTGQSHGEGESGSRYSSQTILPTA
ncbi:hypothetical protein ABFY27_03080 [Akkermansia massiliensis]